MLTSPRAHLPLLNATSAEVNSFARGSASSRNALFFDAKHFCRGNGIDPLTARPGYAHVIHSLGGFNWLFCYYRSDTFHEKRPNERYPIRFRSVRSASPSPLHRCNRRASRRSSIVSRRLRLVKERIYLFFFPSAYGSRAPPRHFYFSLVRRIDRALVGFSGCPKS